MTTKILIKTPYFGDRPYTIEGLQPLLPFPILNITQGSFEFMMEVEGEISPEIVNAVVAQMKNYVLANLITAEIVS